MLASSRDKNEGTYVPKWGGRRRARYVTPDLSYYWEGAREWRERIVNGTKKKKCCEGI